MFPTRFFILACSLSILGCLSSHGLTLNEAQIVQLGFDTTATDLSLKSDNISSIEANTFANFTQLKTLELQNNQLEALEAATFNGLSELETLKIYVIS